MTVEELYDQRIRPLPASERFRLAALILNDIPPQSVADYSGEWSDEDIREASLHSFRRAATVEKMLVQDR